LTIDGKPLPGVTEGDSAFARIEALKMYLEVNVGLEVFLRAYNYMQNLPEMDDNNEQLRSLLGPASMKFVPLLCQLLVCEDNFYSSEAR